MSVARAAAWIRGEWTESGADFGPAAPKSLESQLLDTLLAAPGSGDDACCFSRSKGGKAVALDVLRMISRAITAAEGPSETVPRQTGQSAPQPSLALAQQQQLTQQQDRYDPVRHQAMSKGSDAPHPVPTEPLASLAASMGQQLAQATAANCQAMTSTSSFDESHPKAAYRPPHLLSRPPGAEPSTALHPPKAYAPPASVPAPLPPGPQTGSVGHASAGPYVPPSRHMQQAAANQHAPHHGRSASGERHQEHWTEPQGVHGAAPPAETVGVSLAGRVANGGPSVHFVDGPGPALDAMLERLRLCSEFSLLIHTADGGVLGSFSAAQLFPSSAASALPPPDLAVACFHVLEADSVPSSFLVDLTPRGRIKTSSGGDNENQEVPCSLLLTPGLRSLLEDPTKSKVVLGCAKVRDSRWRALKAKVLFLF